MLAAPGPRDLVGYEIIVDGGVGVCRLEVGARHLNRHGMLHGGFIAMLLDNASGTTASLTMDDAGHTPVMTVTMSVNYLAPVGGGTVTARGRLRGGGRKTVFVDAELTGADGALVATSSGVFRRVG